MLSDDETQERMNAKAEATTGVAHTYSHSHTLTHTLKTQIFKIYVLACVFMPTRGVCSFSHKISQYVIIIIVIEMIIYYDDGIVCGMASPVMSTVVMVGWMAFTFLQKIRCLSHGTHATVSTRWVTKQQPGKAAAPVSGQQKLSKKPCRMCALPKNANSR